MSYYFAKTINTDFETAIERVTAELQKEQFGVLTEIDMQATLKSKVGEKRVISNETNISPTKNKQKPVLKVYPNPSDNGFTIEFPEAIGEYMISNTNGKLIEENKVLTKTTFIQLPKGIYFIKWINKGEVQTQKIIAL